MKEKKETVYELIVRAAGHQVKFKVSLESIPLKICWPEDIDEKVKKELTETIKRNKEEIKRFVIIRDLPRHPIKPEAVVDVAKEVFGGEEVPQQKEGPGSEFPGVPY